MVCTETSCVVMAAEEKSFFTVLFAYNCEGYRFIEISLMHVLFAYYACCLPTNNIALMYKNRTHCPWLHVSTKQWLLVQIVLTFSGAQ